MRSTGSPRRTAAAPRALKASSSASVMPPSGPTTTTISPWSGSATSASGADRRLVQHERRHKLVGRGELTHLGHPRPPALLGRLPRGAAPLLERLGPAWAVPLGDRSCCRPRDDRVDAEFGHRLDREFGALALGQCLNHDKSRVGSRDGAARRDMQVETVRNDGGHGALGEVAAAVADEHLLADGEPSHPRCMPSLVAGQGEGIAAAEVIDEEQRRRHCFDRPRVDLVSPARSARRDPAIHSASSLRSRAGRLIALRSPRSEVPARITA